MFATYLLVCTTIIILIILPRHVIDSQSVMNIAVAMHLTNNNYSTTFVEPTVGNSIYSSYLTTLEPMVAAMKMWQSLINQTGGLRTWNSFNSTVPVNIKFFNAGPTSCPDEPEGVCAIFPTQLATDLANASGPYGSYSVIIAPGFSVDNIVAIFLNACETSHTCIAIAPLTPSPDVFICQSVPLPDDCIMRKIRPGGRRFSYGYSVLYDGSYALSAHLTIMRGNGLTNVVVLGSSLAYGVEASSATEDTIASLNMNTVQSLIFDNTTILSQDAAIQLVQSWIDADVNALCILSNGADELAVADVVEIFNAMQILNWLPGSIAFGGSIATSLATILTEGQLDFTLSAAEWDWHLKGHAYDAYNTTYNLELFPATTLLASPAVFRQTLISYTGVNYTDGEVVYAADAVQALEFVLKFGELAGAYDVISMQASSASVSSATIEGQLQLDSYGRTVVSDQLVFQQLPNGSRIILSPLSIGTSPILPMPSWNERKFNDHFDQQAIEIVSTVTNTIVLLYCLSLIAGFFLLSQHPVMKAATPLFCVLVTVGGILMLLSVYATGLYNTNASCLTQIWFLTLGFSILFASLFARTFRVWRIFNRAQKLKQVRITNQDLLGQLSCVILFDVILNGIWTAVSPATAVYVYVDEFRPSYDYYRCDFSGTSGQFAIASMAEKGLLLLAGIVLTYLSRAVPSKFNETGYLAAAIYNCALLSTFVVALVATGIGDRSVTFAVQAFGIQLAVVSTLSILFLPKFNLILFNPEKLNKQTAGTLGKEELVRAKLGPLQVDEQNKITSDKISNSGATSDKSVVNSNRVAPLVVSSVPTSTNNKLSDASLPTQEEVNKLIAAAASDPTLSQDSQLAEAQQLLKAKLQRYEITLSRINQQLLNNSRKISDQAGSSINIPSPIE